MKDGDRIAGLEEQLMLLQRDQEQLDEVIRSQAETIDRLQRRLDELEQRLDKLEPDML